MLYLTLVMNPSPKCAHSRAHYSTVMLLSVHNTSQMSTFRRPLRCGYTTQCPICVWTSPDTFTTGQECRKERKCSTKYCLHLTPTADLKKQGRGLFECRWITPCAQEDLAKFRQRSYIPGSKVKFVLEFAICWPCARTNRYVYFNFFSKIILLTSGSPFLSWVTLVH